MRIESQPGTSTGLVPGRYRVKTSQPGTELEAFQDSLFSTYTTSFISQVPGYGEEGVSHMHAYARPHMTTLQQPGQPGTNLDNAVQDATQPGTANPVPSAQPGTDTGRLLSLIAHAQGITRSNPDFYPILQAHPTLRTHARALVDAATQGEDVEALSVLADALERNLYRIQNGTQQASPDKFTNGRAKDRLNRKSAQPRTTAPTRRTPEVPMRASAASAEVKKPVRRPTTNPADLMEQLGAEYEAAERSGAHSDHLALLAHALTCLSPALHWVGGNAATAEFPATFAGERLAKSCAWLRGLATAPTEQVEAARSQMVAALHQLWPAYCEACSDKPLSDGQEYAERQWDLVNRLDGLWVDPAPGSLAAPAPYLPEFRDTECGRVSYSFHLTLLSLVTLNRQLGRPLLAFEVSPHGRN